MSPRLKNVEDLIRGTVADKPHVVLASVSSEKDVVSLTAELGVIH